MFSETEVDGESWQLSTLEHVLVLSLPLLRSFGDPEQVAKPPHTVFVTCRTVNVHGAQGTLALQKFLDENHILDLLLKKFRPRWQSRKSDGKQLS